MNAEKSTVFAVVPPFVGYLAPGGFCPDMMRRYSTRPRSRACRRTLATLLGCGLRPFRWTIVLATSRSFKKHVAPNEATTPMNCAVNREAPKARASPAALLPRSSNDPGQVNWPPLKGPRAVYLCAVTVANG